MRSWTDLEIFLKKVSLRVSTSKYNRMKQVNDVSLHLQDKWELFGPVGPDLREIWPRLDRWGDQADIQPNEVQAAVRAALFGAGADCQPLWKRPGILAYLQKLTLETSNRRAAICFALGFWEIWPEDTMGFNDLVKSIKAVKQLDPALSDSFKRGYFERGFCESIGKRVPDSRFLEPYAEERTELFRRPSMNMFRRIWRARFPQYGEMMKNVFMPVQSVAIAKGNATFAPRCDRLKQRLDFINQDSRINNRLIDESLINEFGHAILEPFLDKFATKMLPDEKEQVLIVDFFERIIGPSAQLHDRRFSTLDDELKTLLKRWMNGRKLNWAFDVIDSATRRQIDNAKTEQWMKRREYWQGIWSKGYIDEIQVFMRKRLADEYRFQHPDIQLLVGAPPGISAIVITLTRPGSNPIQVIEMSGNGALRLFNMHAFPGLDFRRKRTLDYGDVKYLKDQEGKFYTINHTRYWTTSADEKIQILLNYRM